MACSSSTQSVSSEENSDECDEMLVILDLLNLKIVNKQPGDQGYSNENEFCDLLDKNIFASQSVEESDELKKWKKYAEFLEKRALETEANFIELKSEKKKIQKLYESSKGQILELTRQLKDCKKQSTDQQIRSKNLEQENQHFKMKQADLAMQIQKLRTANDSKILKLETENIKLKASVNQAQDQVWKLQDKIKELEKGKKKVETDFQNKVDYLKEVERIMDQQQQVLRNSKDKHKKVKEELQDKIIELELNIGAKDIEIEKLKNDLDENKVKRQKIRKIL